MPWQLPFQLRPVSITITLGGECLKISQANLVTVDRRSERVVVLFSLLVTEQECEVYFFCVWYILCYYLFFLMMCNS